MGKKRRKKKQEDAGPSAFFVIVLVLGLLFVLWMIVQAVLTNPWAPTEQETPATDTEAPAE